MAISAASARLALDTTSGLPSLPHIPGDWITPLTEEQQKENLLHVALWIVEHDLVNFDMSYWHEAWINRGEAMFILAPDQAFKSCGTVHCIAGFAQVMGGPYAFSVSPWVAARFLLGEEAGFHFHDNKTQGLDFLKRVIAEHS
jgi:hypothetical protein